MKKIITVILSLIICTVLNTVYGTNFYISTSKGNDINAGTSKGAPWATINKLNSKWTSINPGDSILFEKGEVFLGSILVGKSGTSGNPIVIGSYGTGNAPIITGYETLSGFVNPTVGLYQVPFSPAKVNFINLEFDGVMQRFGRTPNANATLPTYESYVNKTTFTDNQMPVIAGIDSAEIGIRKARWIWERGKVTSKSGNTITYGLTGNNVNGSPGVYYDFYGTGMGWFVQNSLSTLDQTGEFYFRNSTKVLYVFSSDAITNHIVRASAVDKLIILNNNSYITVENLYLEGANVSAIQSGGGTFVQIKNNTIRNSGAMGIQLTNVSNLLIDKNDIDWSLSTGIQADGGSSITVTNNKVNHSYPYEAMGDYGSDGNCLRGIVTNGNNILVQYNVIKNSGFTGLKFQGNNILIKNNLIDTFTLVQDDNAGVYSYVGDETKYGPAKVNYSNRYITDNIILHGMIASYGASSSPYSSGIYSDGKNNNLNITNNFVAYTASNGVIANNPKGFFVSKNTFYNVPIGIKYNTYKKGVAGDYVADSNIFVHANPTDKNFTYNTDTLRYGSIAAEIFTVMTLNNSFTYLLNKQPFAVIAPAPLYAPFSFSAWNSFTGLEGKSKLLKSFPTYNVTSILGPNKYPNPSLTIGITGITTYSATGAWDNTNQITNGSYRVTFSTTTPQSYGVMFANVGVISGKYIFKFKTRGTTGNGFLRVFAGLVSNPTLAQTPKQTAIYSTPITQHEFLLDVPNINGTVNIEFDRSSGTTYVDDIEFYSVSATTNNIQDSIRVEYASKDTNIVNLAYKYKDIYGKVYNGGNDTILPYQSKVYLYEGVTDAPANIPPVVDAGTNQSLVLPTNTITLTATATDSDGTIVSKVWNKISGGSVTITNPYQLSTSVLLSTPGTYVFSFTATDNSGETTSDTITVTLLSMNVLPIVNAGKDTTLRLPVNSRSMYGVATDPDGTIASYLWYKVSGPSTYTIATPTNKNTIIANLVAGTYVFALQVTDDRGGTKTDNVTIVVGKKGFISLPIISNIKYKQLIQL